MSPTEPTIAAWQFLDIFGPLPGLVEPYLRVSYLDCICYRDRFPQLASSANLPGLGIKVYVATRGCLAQQRIDGIRLFGQ
jgi:hypothetical protein